MQMREGHLPVAGQMRETWYFAAITNVAAARLLGKLCDQAGAEQRPGLSIWARPPVLADIELPTTYSKGIVTV